MREMDEFGEDYIIKRYHGSLYIISPHTNTSYQHLIPSPDIIT
jgi:hypothetical protein